MSDAAACDIVERLRLLAGWVDADENAEAEMHIFKAAAGEIERLRGQLERIAALANTLAPP
ncbi:hypothetical protein [Lichenicoccus sp.]|uniref:hypothetical protein n=1 Tax=Lichenicoccus sp. TaxID=2781899 RepID=UPI003D09C6D9